MLRTLAGRRSIGFARRTHALRTLARIDQRLGLGPAPTVDAPTTAVPVDPEQFRDSLILNGATGLVRYGDAVQPFQRQRYADLDSALVAVAMGEQPPCGRHWWEATKGASKDTDLGLCILWLLSHSERFLDIQIGAADRDQAGELKKAAQGILHHNAWLREAGIDIQQNAILNRRTGSRAHIVAADVAGSHGARPDVLIINELHAIKPGHREFAQNLMDNARKVPNGVVVIATNAGDVGSWQWEWREYARNSPRWAFHRLAKPAPWIAESELEESERTNSPARHRRLWYGEWAMGKEGAEWEKHPEYFGEHLWATDLEWPKSFEMAVVACDPSKGKKKGADPSAIIFAGVARGLIWLRADIEVRPAETIVTRLVETWYGEQRLATGRPVHGQALDGMVIEENQFQFLLATLCQHECERRGLAPLPVSLYNHTAAADKKTRIRRLGPFLADRRFRVYNDEGGVALVRMLRNFGTDQDHDDGPDATEMAVRLINTLSASRAGQRPEERVTA